MQLTQVIEVKIFLYGCFFSTLRSTMIQLYQAPPVWGLPNMSPFCVKLETYLRMAKIEYEKPKFDFSKAPKGKIPFVGIDGKCIRDSGLIIQELKKNLETD